MRAGCTTYSLLFLRSLREICRDLAAFIHTSDSRGVTVKERSRRHERPPNTKRQIQSNPEAAAVGCYRGAMATQADVADNRATRSVARVAWPRPAAAGPNARDDLPARRVAATRRLHHCWKDLVWSKKLIRDVAAALADGYVILRARLCGQLGATGRRSASKSPKRLWLRICAESACASVHVQRGFAALKGQPTTAGG
jgi:hypothetical protein